MTELDTQSPLASEHAHCTLTTNQQKKEREGGRGEGGQEEEGMKGKVGRREERRRQEEGKLTWKIQYSPRHELPTAAHVSPLGGYRAGVWLPLL